MLCSHCNNIDSTNLWIIYYLSRNSNIEEEEALR